MTDDMRKVVFDSYSAVNGTIRSVVSEKERYATVSVGVRMKSVPFLEICDLKGDNMDFYCLPTFSKVLKEKLDLLSQYEGVPTLFALGDGHKYSGGMQTLIYPATQVFVVVEGYQSSKYNDVFALLLTKEIAERRFLLKYGEIRYAPITDSWYREVLLNEPHGGFLQEALKIGVV